jgi:hypothetical protein
MTPIACSHDSRRGLLLCRTSGALYKQINYRASLAKSFEPCRPLAMSGRLCSPSNPLDREIQTRFVLAKCSTGLPETALFLDPVGHTRKLRVADSFEAFARQRSLSIESGMRNDAVYFIITPVK